MFQTGAVQRNAFQLGGASRTSAAFQQGAFQGGAFQVYSGTASTTPPSSAFQQDAFQQGAFQMYGGTYRPPTPSTPTITGGWSDWMPRKPRRKDEEDEPEIETPAPREVVKTDKVVTGVVQYAPPLPPWPKSDVSAKFARMENESRIEYRKRIRRIIAADDEWLMLH